MGSKNHPKSGSKMWSKWGRKTPPNRGRNPGVPGGGPGGPFRGHFVLVSGSFRSGFPTVSTVFRQIGGHKKTPIRRPFHDQGDLNGISTPSGTPRKVRKNVFFRHPGGYQIGEALFSPPEGGFHSPPVLPAQIGVKKRPPKSRKTPFFPGFSVEKIDNLSLFYR